MPAKSGLVVSLWQIFRLPYPSSPPLRPRNAPSPSGEPSLARLYIDITALLYSLWQLLGTHTGIVTLGERTAAESLSSPPLSRDRASRNFGPLDFRVFEHG